MDPLAEGLVVLSAACNTWFVVKLMQRGSFTAPFVFLMHLTSKYVSLVKKMKEDIHVRITYGIAVHLLKKPILTKVFGYFNRIF